MKRLKVARQLQLDDIVRIGGEFRQVGMRAHKDGDSTIAIWHIPIGKPKEVGPVHIFKADELVEVREYR